VMKEKQSILTYAAFNIFYELTFIQTLLPETTTVFNYFNVWDEVIDNWFVRIINNLILGSVKNN